MLIGRIEKLKRIEENFNPYASYIECAAREGIRAFYILARGALNCLVADETVAQATKGNVLIKTDEYTDKVEYEGRKIPVVCIRLENLTVTENPLTAYRKAYY